MVSRRQVRLALEKRGYTMVVNECKSITIDSTFGDPRRRR